MRKKVTIPAAGETIPISMTGRSVLTEFANLYYKPEHVPQVGFNSGDNKFPIYPQSTYPNPTGKFNNLTITGTAESEGDELWLITVEECLAAAINIQFRDSYRSEPGTTFTKAASDVPQSLSALELENSEGDLPTKLYISVSPTAGTAGIKWAINANPVQGDDALGTSLNPGESLPVELINIEWMLDFRFIAQVAAETPVVNFTPEY